jgi:hypothetical protein
MIYGKMMLLLLGEQNPPLAIRVFFPLNFVVFHKVYRENLAIILKFVL